MKVEMPHARCRQSWEPSVAIPIAGIERVARFITEYESFRPRVVRQFPYAVGGNSIAFSPDGHLLAIGLDSATTVLYDVPTGRRLALIPSNLGSTITDVSFSPDGTRLAVAGIGGVVNIVEVNTRTPAPHIPGPRHHVRDALLLTCASSRDGRRLRTGLLGMPARAVPSAHP